MALELEEGLLGLQEILVCLFFQKVLVVGLEVGQHVCEHGVV